MDRELNEADLIDLGAASVETQGGEKGNPDLVGFIPQTGLSDD